MKKPAPPKTGPITKALDEAVALRRQYLDGGMEEREADRIVGQALKGVLGNKRPDAWRFYCEHCRDTGWVNVQPSTQELARLTVMYGEHPQAHGYVVKCELCKWTQIEREKRRQKMGQDFSGGDEDLAAAGQTKRGFLKLTR